MTEITFIIVKIDYDPVLYPNHAYGLIGTRYRAQTLKGIWISKSKVCIDLFKDPQLVFQSSTKKIIELPIVTLCVKPFPGFCILMKLVSKKASLDA